MLITSSSNEHIKAARRVRDGRERGLLFLEGGRLVRDALHSHVTLLTCFHPPAPSPSIAGLLPELASKGARLLAVTPRVLDALGDTLHSQGLIVIGQRPAADAAAFWPKLPPAPLLVALDRVQDPGNLGTILRSAEAAGADGLITLAGSADVFSPKTLRASMGSALRLPVLPNLSPDELLASARRLGLRLLAASGSAIRNHRDLDWRGPVLLILGNEGSGVSPTLHAVCEESVRIPIKAPVESLNVAAAATVLLFEAAHQRGAV